MKIIHCGDLHLDSRMESNLDKDKAIVRRRELLETFRKMVAYAKAEEVRVILIAGDMFDKPHIRKEARDQVWEQIRENPQIDFCYLRGNHDRCDFLTEPGESERPDNLKLFSYDGWTSYDYGEVVITGMELSGEQTGTLGADLVLDQSRCNIVMLHGQESEYEGRDRTQIVPLEGLRNKCIDYLALGHIHSFRTKRLDNRGMSCYCGCLEGRGFDECGEKGFVLLDVADGKVTPRFMPFAKRTLHEITCELTPEADMPAILDRVRQVTADIPSKDLVKVVLTGTTELDREIDLGRVLDFLRERFFFAKAYDQTQPAIRYEDFVNDRSLKGEFVRLMQEQDMSEEQRGAIIELGIRAILGEEI